MLGRRLCALIKASEPRIYKDQLVGVKGLLSAHKDLDLTLIEPLCEKPRLSATLLRDYLDAYVAHPERLQNESRAVQNQDPATVAALARYAGIGVAIQEMANDCH